MKPEAGEWPIPMRFSRDRAGSRQATGPKQLLTLRQPGSHPFAPSFRWDPSPRRKCESPPQVRVTRPGQGRVENGGDRSPDRGQEGEEIFTVPAAVQTILMLHEHPVDRWTVVDEIRQSHVGERLVTAEARPRCR